MAVFKCKMCGGTIEFEQGASVGVCDSCGTKQTLPRLDDDKKSALYDRANHFRRNNEFDKAMGIYEQILNEDNTDAEAYWSLVLCKYGIEYVEDPSSRKRIPTVNRAQYTAVFDDENYKAAMQYADGYQREIYEKEAKAINEIQKGILAISQQEDPFDVFICYKETDNNGRRTPDSVLANDLYHQLTQEGFKVFFARITLEDKLGTAYEPYIFAALNSAKVMVVLGTKPEFFQAVWVKNEWSRYLALIKSGAKKMLIPAYKDMDPYDLPEEFAHLQSQDMSKLGFMQDLIRGIKKITSPEETKTVVRDVVQNRDTDIATLLKRASIFLLDRNWDSANEYCEKVLESNPENAEAYLYKLMAEIHVKKEEDITKYYGLLSQSNNYEKIILFADNELKNRVEGYNKTIAQKNEEMLNESATVKKAILDEIEDLKKKIKTKRIIKALIGGILIPIGFILMMLLIISTDNLVATIPGGIIMAIGVMILSITAAQNVYFEIELLRLNSINRFPAITSNVTMIVENSSWSCHGSVNRTVYTIVLSGTITSGNVEVGDIIYIGNTAFPVNSIAREGELIESASTGMNVKLGLLSKKSIVLQKGDIISGISKGE